LCNGGGGISRLWANGRDRREIIVIRRHRFYSPRVIARQIEESPMTFNPKEWRKLSERQRQAIIRKIEREEKRAKTVMVVMVFILVFALLLALFAVMSSCPTPQDTTPTGREYETQAQQETRGPPNASSARCSRPHGIHLRV
jgi:hypothetical protein